MTRDPISLEQNSIIRVAHNQAHKRPFSIPLIFERCRRMHLHTLWDSQSYFPKQSTRKAKASDSLFVFDPLSFQAGCHQGPEEKRNGITVGLDCTSGAIIVFSIIALNPFSHDIFQQGRIKMRKTSSYVVLQRKITGSG